VLDGAGGPSELPSGCVHGTPWYVRQLGARLLAVMETSPVPLEDILAGAIGAVSDAHRNRCDLTAPGTPATVVVMARASGHSLEWLVLGDGTLVLDLGDRIKTVSDRRIDQVAAAEKAAMEALPTGTPEHQAARIAFVTLQRQMRNQPDGYWTASTDPRAASYAFSGIAPLAQVRRMALVSDGASRFTEFGLGDWREFLGVLDVHGPSAVLARIREAEDADPLGRRWPRAKRRDDAAIVHFTSRASDANGRLDLTSELARRLGRWDAGAPYDDKPNRVLEETPIGR
jgi:hypothetical protein